MKKKEISEQNERMVGLARKREVREPEPPPPSIHTSSIRRK